MIQIRLIFIFILTLHGLSAMEEKEGHSNRSSSRRALKKSVIKSKSARKSIYRNKSMLAEIENKNEREENARLLIAAIKEKQFEQIAKLLDEDTDFDYCDSEGNSPLSVAIFLREAVIVHSLLERGADVRSGKNNPLQIARYMAQWEGSKITVMDQISASIWRELNTHFKETYHISDNDGSCTAWRCEKCECASCTERLVNERLRDPHVRRDDDSPTVAHATDLINNLNMTQEETKVQNASKQSVYTNLRSPPKRRIYLNKRPNQADPNDPLAQFDALMEQFSKQSN